MKTIIQTDNFGLLEEAAKSGCDGVRFGSEFCEYKLPTQNTLEKAYEIAQEKGKEFMYVTPRLSNSGIEKVRKQLAYLNQEGVGVVFNDLGLLNILRRCANTPRHVGRQLIRVPARSPWAERIARDGIIMAKQVGTAYYELTTGDPTVKRWYQKLFSHTSLDYPMTIEFFKAFGVRAADIDWIPSLLPSINFLMRQGIDLSVHLHLAPVSITRKCHTARFTGEDDPEKCSKPCLDKTYRLRNEMLDIDLFLIGNAVFRMIEPSGKDLKKLRETNVAELVVTMNAITNMTCSREIDDFLKRVNQ